MQALARFSPASSTASAAGRCSTSPRASRLISTRKLQPQQKASTLRRAASADDAPQQQQAPVYQGVYGPWSIDEADLREVATYRAGLTVAAVALVLGAAPALLPGTPVAAALEPLSNPACLVGAGALGVSYVLIHIYVAPLKRFLQAMWAAGTLGGLYLMASQDESVPAYVMQHPGAVWLIGPLFASVTGLAFKEGMCYGKPESAAMFFAVPALCLAHLSGGCPPALERGLLLLVVVLASVFAARKYGQAPKDDIGDKSVFTFQALPPAEQEQVLMGLQAREREQQAQRALRAQQDEWQ